MSEDVEGDLPVVARDEAPPADPDDLGTVAGILLAAGESTRYGSDNKLLATIDGEPVVRRATRTLLEAGLGVVLVVTGHESERIREALAGLDLHFAANPDYETGQGSSVTAGVRTLFEGAVVPDAVVFALGDMPAVEPGTVRRLVGAYRAGHGDALAAAFEGSRGNPVLFDAEHLPALGDVQGDGGARDILLGSDAAALVETGDPGVLADVDDPDDLAAVAALRED